MDHDEYRNTSGNRYSTGTWLDNHHAVKNRLRSELVHHLPLKPGARVLDIGCGTGLWSLLFAERVGHKGFVHGLDVDYASIHLAKERMDIHYLKNNLKFEQVDVMNFDTKTKYDYITIFNVLSYIDCPDVLLNNTYNLLEDNGLLLIKDSDIESDFFWPVNIELYHRLLEGIHKSNQFALNGYDAFFARKIPDLLHKCKYTILHLTSQSFSFCSPVDKYERMYIKGNGDIIGQHAASAGDLEGAELWAKLFQDDDQNCIFNQPDFLYTMTEFLFQAQAPTNS